MADDRGRTEHTEEPAEGGREEGEAAEARVREEQQDDEEELSSPDGQDWGRGLG